jgi:hypothetical protein
MELTQVDAAQKIYCLGVGCRVFLAHNNKDDLHRLAPKRRAPVLKLLERMRTNSDQAK